MGASEINYQADVVIAGGGLASLVAAYDLLGTGKKILILERDSPEELGGLAKKSFGGIMMVDTPYQRKKGIRDSPDIAWRDWQSFAEFAPEDELPRAWARRYVEQSIPYIFEWAEHKKIKFLPIVNWPERGLFRPGNSLPRWHITWGTGKEIIARLLAALDSHPNRSQLDIHFGHRVENIIKEGGRAVAFRGTQESFGEKPGAVFAARGEALVLASGGICGGDMSAVREHWDRSVSEPPPRMVNGSHRFADGLLHYEARRVGARLTHLEKQWHYAAGIHHPESKRRPGGPYVQNEGLSLVPPRGALWMNAYGERIGPMPLTGYTDTRYLVEQICRQPGQFSWQIMNWKIAIKELAVSGSEFMTAFVNKSKPMLVKNLLFGNKALVRRLMNESEDVVVADNLSGLVKAMNELETSYQVNAETLERDIRAYDDQIDRGEKFFNDDQLRRIMNFRTYLGDRIRTCKYQKILDPKAGPLIAIREFILSRKSLGGIQTNLDCQVMDSGGEPIDGLFAVGEAAGFGGGGIHGRGSLEGTFLGSCILTGRVAAETISGKKILG